MIDMEHTAAAGWGYPETFDPVYESMGIRYDQSAIHRQTLNEMMSSLKDISTEQSPSSVQQTLPITASMSVDVADNMVNLPATTGTSAVTEKYVGYHT